MRNVTAVSYHVCQKNQSVVFPYLANKWLWNLTSNGKAMAGGEVASIYPAFRS